MSEPIPSSSLPSSFDDDAIRHEEWLFQYSKLQEELDNDDVDTMSNNGELLGKAIMCRAGRLGSLQIASSKARGQRRLENADGTDTKTMWIESLLDATRREMDVDAASPKQLALLERLLVSEEENNDDSDKKQKKDDKLRQQEDQFDVQLNVDAFFDEYPECRKENYNSYDINSSSDDDDDDEEEDALMETRKKQKSKKKKKRKNKHTSTLSSQSSQRQEEVALSHTATADKSHINHLPPPSRPMANDNNAMVQHSQPPSQQQQQQHAPVKNPYQQNIQQVPAAHPSRGQNNNNNHSEMPPPIPHQRQESSSSTSSSLSQRPGAVPRFNYTQCTADENEQQPPPPRSSWERQQNQQYHHQQQQQQQNRGTINNGGMNNSMSNNSTRNPYQRQQHQPQIQREYSNNVTTTFSGNHNQYGGQGTAAPTSWEEHQNQQNPFQTAREAQMSGIGDNTNTDKSNRSSSYDNLDRSGNGNREGKNSRYCNNTNNPSYFDQPPSYSDTNENSMANARGPINGGPRIPESLQRKYRPPTKGGSQKPSASSSSSSSNTNKGPQGQQQKRKKGEKDDSSDEEELPEELQHLDKELVKKIQNEIIESGDTITFDDIAGLYDVKQTVQEVVCWPMKRPDLFTGLRRAPNGLLLYGPPGTGKTLIGKAIAHESGATFFSISSSSLTSKWIGEGEKLVRTLFAVAAYREPAVVFIDEIDSLLTQRKSTENEASRRIKTEFLVQLDGTGTSAQGRVLVIGATNRPQELDEAARRRFIKRLYVPLPTESDRQILLNVLLKTNNHILNEHEVHKLAKETDGFSGADLKALCTDAAMGPIRQLGPRALEVNVGDVPPISYKHFRKSLKGTKPSVAPADLVQYEEWDATYGSKRDHDEDDDDDEESDDEDKNSSK